MLRKWICAFACALSCTAVPGFAFIGEVDCAGDCNSCCESCVCAVFDVDLLVWGNFATRRYAVNREGLSSGTQGGCDVYYNSDWTPNFRVGVDCPLITDCWDLHADYTWIYSNPTDKRNGPVDGDGAIIRVFRPAISKITGANNIDYHNIEADIGTNINMIQINARRLFCFNRGVQFRPYAGFGLFFVSNKRNYDFFNGLSGDDTATLVIRQKVGLKDGMMTIGFQTSWTFCDCYTFFSDTKGGVLLGNQTYRCIETQTVGTTPTITNADRCIDQVSIGSFAQAQIGFSRAFSLCGYYGEGHIGWEAATFSHGQYRETYTGVTIGLAGMF